MDAAAALVAWLRGWCADAAPAELFLSRRTADGAWVETPYRTPQALAELAAAAVAADQQGAECFLAPCTFRAPAHERLRRTRAQVHEVLALVLDCDRPVDPAACDPPPTYVVETSPGHHHLWWRLDPPLDAATAARAKAALYARVPQADPGAKAVVQPARLPFTHHRKGPVAHPVRLLVADGPALDAAAVAALVASLPPPAPAPAAPAEAGPALDDAALLERAFRAANGEVVRALWEGRYQEALERLGRDDRSRSQADWELACALGFYAGPRGHDQVERLMRRSALVRPKWDTPRGDTTYLRDTIRKALAQREAFYDPRGIADQLDDPAVRALLADRARQVAGAARPAARASGAVAVGRPAAGAATRLEELRQADPRFRRVWELFGDPALYQDPRLGEWLADASIEFPTYTAAELAARTPAPPLVEGLLYQDTVVSLTGATSLGKTTAALALAAHVAWGLPFGGRPVADGRVLYALGEGQDAVTERLQDLARYHQRALPDDRLLLTTEVPRFADPAHTLLFAWWVAQRAGDPACPLRLLVIDTLGRAMAGLDENKQLDMARVCTILDRLRRLTQACVLVIHHTGKDGRLERGSSVLEQWVDTRLFLRPHYPSAQLVRLEVAKQKRALAGGELVLWRRPLSPRGVVVVADAAVPAEARAPSEELMARVLRRLVDLLPNGGNSDELLKRLPEEPDLTLTALEYTLKAMVERGWLELGGREGAKHATFRATAEGQAWLARRGGERLL